MWSLENGLNPCLDITCDLTSTDFGDGGTGEEAGRDGDKDGGKEAEAGRERERGSLCCVAEHSSDGKTLGLLHDA